MSPQAQRIAIAEACGWITNPDPKDHSGHRYYAPKGTSPFLGRHALPEYLNDLNRMHEATQSLTKDQLRWYRNLLIEMTGTFEAIDATAAQRAEAFLRAIGKWEEEAKP